jgi:hypothetical protein
MKMAKKEWTEENGVIRFFVKSDGTTGEAWIPRLKFQKFYVGGYAQSVLRSTDFHPTNGVTTEVAVLKGELFTDDERFTEKIRAEAKRHNLQTPNAEISCLIREKFSNKDIETMGLRWIVAMHEPIDDSDDDPALLSVDCSGRRGSLEAFCGRPVNRWNREDGFAFACLR